jgi:hypothetical protein
MVVNGYRELPLRGFLADHVLVEEVLDFKRFGDLVGTGRDGLRPVVVKYRVADRNALVADVGACVFARRRNQLPDDILTFVTKGTTESVISSSALQAILRGIAGQTSYEVPIGSVPIILHLKWEIIKVLKFQAQRGLKRG